MFVDRTYSMPKSVLHYLMDKVRFLNLVTCLNPILFFPYRGEHGYLSSRISVVILNIFEMNYSQLIQYEILEKLVTWMVLKVVLLMAIEVNINCGDLSESKNL